jgi:hypothetical protein
MAEPVAVTALPQARETHFGIVLGLAMGLRSVSAWGGSPMHCCCRQCGSISAGAIRRRAR